MKFVIELRLTFLNSFLNKNHLSDSFLNVGLPTHVLIIQTDDIKTENNFTYVILLAR